MSAGVEDNENRATSTAVDSSALDPRPADRSPTNGAVRSSPTPQAHPVPAEHSDLSPPAVAPESSVAASLPAPGGHHHHHHDHHVLIDVEEDRWAWRRKIRQNPRKLAFYRVAVGLGGLLLIAFGLLTGPLPGPGGIPLILLGLAIWSSEFEWAQRVMVAFKRQLRKYRTWTRPQQVLFWVVFFTGCGALAYLYMLTLGVPFWMPPFGEELLQRLPGV